MGRAGQSVERKAASCDYSSRHLARGQLQYQQDRYNDAKIEPTEKAARCEVSKRSRRAGGEPVVGIELTQEVTLTVAPGVSMG